MGLIISVISKSQASTKKSLKMALKPSLSLNMGVDFSLKAS